MEFIDLDPISEAAVYKPLGDNEIRLALLSSSPSTSSPITIHLLPVPISHAPSFDALSYVWGTTNPSDTLPVLCDGIPVQVTRNLDWALRRVRLPSSSGARLVWADALCINQNDPQERGAQVALMGRIYARARRVLVCLGDDKAEQGGRGGGGARHVESLLRDYAPILARPHGVDDILRFWRQGGMPPEEDPRWAALGPLLALPWFRRAWVLQETGLARDPRVVYGSSSLAGSEEKEEEFISYRDLMTLVVLIRVFDADFAAEMRIGALLIHTQWSDWSADDWARTEDHRRCRFADLLDHGALLDCQDPRDRIYAFLGHPLAAAQTGERIVPDYTKDKLQVYKETAVLLLRDAGVRTLSSVEHSAATVADDQRFPTWVVRWDVGFVANNIYTHPVVKYAADRGLTGSRSCVPRIKNDVLHLHGAVVDIIAIAFIIHLIPDSLTVLFETTTATRNGSTSRGTIEDIMDYLEALDLDPKMPQAYKGAAPADILAHALCCELSDAHGRSKLSKTFRHYLRWKREGEGDTPFLADARVFWSLAAENCEGRAFVVTRGGRYGLASRISQPGDLCCVVQGSTVPFIMRPKKPERSRHFRLVGEAYIHGIMQGEVAEMVRQGRLVEDTIFVH